MLKFIKNFFKKICCKKEKNNEKSINGTYYNNSYNPYVFYDNSIPKDISTLIILGLGDYNYR